MNKHELQYCTTRKERLAVVTALKHFYYYLLSQKVKLRADNSAVSWIRTLKNPTGQVIRWLQYIETYDISVTHRPGRSHGNADALSFIPCKVCQRQEQNRSKVLMNTTPTYIRKQDLITSPKQSYLVQLREGSSKMRLLLS